MKPYIILLNLLSFFIFTITSAQSTVDRVLENIYKNNKSLELDKQFWEAQTIQYKTGLTPDNPAAEYDFLSGSPAGTGNQHEFAIVQSFDFPTAYIKKSQLAKQQISQVEFELITARQNILVKAKLYCIELVYRNKLQMYVARQKQLNEKLLNDFQTKLDRGEGTILEVNKAKLQLVEAGKEFQENLSAIAELNGNLTLLNGGIEISFGDTLFPRSEFPDSFEQLEKDYINTDPVKKSLEVQKNISQKSLELSRARRLPEFEAGYRYQGMPGQDFNGIHTSITIPLWENKNTVKLQRANLLYHELNLQDHRLSHYSELKQLYNKYASLKIILQDYQNVLSASNNESLLTKALELGEISAFEYFTEINNFNTVVKNYLYSEKEYHRVMALLLKYQL